MKKIIKILNLYSGLGGNRKLWNKLFSIKNQCYITAIENDRAIADIYYNNFPNDKIVITDAHQYLLEHYKEFDFIWSSRLVDALVFNKVILKFFFLVLCH